MAQGIYRGELLTPVEFDPFKVLPPDAMSEYMGRVAFRGAWYARFLSDDRDFSARVLIPGVGSGIIAAGLISEQMKWIERGEYLADFPIHIDSFDISPDAVTIAEANINRQAKLGHGITSQIYLDDWRDLRSEVANNDKSYDVIVMNPPYLTEYGLRDIREGYDATPQSNLVDCSGNRFGLGEYEHLLPVASRLTKGQPGSVILGRFAVGAGSSSRITDMLHEEFVRTGKYPNAHINVKSYKGNFVTKAGERRSYSAFLVEPVGMIYQQDGNPINVYWVPEFIDAKIRDKIVPADDYSVSYGAS